MALIFGGSGVGSGRNSTTINMQAGSSYLIPAGTWFLDLGPYTDYQVYDTQTGSWRTPGVSGPQTFWVSSDGVNHRLVIQTGCVVGATVTSGGAGYTSAPVVTINSGGSKFTAVLGPVLNTVTVVNGGTGYVYPPIVNVNPPPAGGVAASGYSTISGGVVTSVTVIDQGAGFSAGIPLVTLSNDPRDSVGTGATAVASLTGTGTVAALIPTDFGTPSGISTSGTLPTITLTGGGYTTIATAVPIMAWSATSYALTSAGSGYQSAIITAVATASGTAIYNNPTFQKNSLRSQAASINGNVSSGALTTGGTIYTGGIYAQSPTVVVIGATSGGATSVAIPTLTLGGNDDVALLLPV